MTSTADVPFPALRASLREPYALVVPYSMLQVVPLPPGSTVPLTIALRAPTEVAGPVVAAGAPALAGTAATSAASAAATTGSRRLIARSSLRLWR